MGGKNPAIIDDSADIADAANKIAFGTTMLGGQICLAPDYILTPHDKLQATVEALKTSFTNFFNPDGKGFAASADYPRIVNLHHVQRIGRLIEDAVSKGAKIVYGGQIDFQQRLITPTIITGMTEDMEIFQEEIFGPVITVQGYAARVDVFAEINKRPKPLGVYVFAGNEAAARFFLDGTRGGSSCVNNVFLQANVPSMPFGGCNHSGIGRLNGHAGFLEFSNQRGVVQDAFDPASGPPMFYPPFPEMAATFVEQMLTPS
jgi:aldehyde dehydrogenase (NAD+)